MSTDSFSWWALLPQMLDGAVTTLQLATLAVSLGFFLGIVLYLGSISRYRCLSWFVSSYVSLFRGTPVLTQLLLIYYVPSAFGISVPGMLAATVGLTLNTAAYQSQILGAGFRAIPAGQLEAASTFNLSSWQRLSIIQIPQVVRNTLPTLISEMIDVIKASAVVSVIAVTDLMRVAQQLSSSTYQPMKVYVAAGVGYLLITSLLSMAGYYAHRKLHPESRKR